MINLNTQALIEIEKRIPRKSVVALGSGIGTLDVASLLQDMSDHIKGVITSSPSIESRLYKRGLPILDPNSVDIIDIYIDTSEEVSKDFVINKKRDLKFTRAKIMAYQAREFICVTQKDNYVDSFENTTVLVEVLPYARNLVGRKVKILGADTHWHKDVITENGNQILELHKLDLDEPWEVEDMLDLIPGVVSSSIFATVPPDVLVVMDEQLAKSVIHEETNKHAATH